MKDRSDKTGISGGKAASTSKPTVDSPQGPLSPAEKLAAAVAKATTALEKFEAARIAHSAVKMTNESAEAALEKAKKELGAADLAVKTADEAKQKIRNAGLAALNSQPTPKSSDPEEDWDSEPVQKPVRVQHVIIPPEIENQIKVAQDKRSAAAKAVEEAQKNVVTTEKRLGVEKRSLGEAESNYNQAIAALEAIKKKEQEPGLLLKEEARRLESDIKRIDGIKKQIIDNAQAIKTAQAKIEKGKVDITGEISKLAALATKTAQVQSTVPTAIPDAPPMDMATAPTAIPDAPPMDIATAPSAIPDAPPMDIATAPPAIPDAPPMDMATAPAVIPDAPPMDMATAPAVIPDAPPMGSITTTAPKVATTGHFAKQPSTREKLSKKAQPIAPVSVWEKERKRITDIQKHIRDAQAETGELVAKVNGLAKKHAMESLNEQPFSDVVAKQTALLNALAGIKAKLEGKLGDVQKEMNSGVEKIAAAKTAAELAQIEAAKKSLEPSSATVVGSIPDAPPMDATGIPDAPQMDATGVPDAPPMNATGVPDAPPMDGALFTPATGGRSKSDTSTSITTSKSKADAPKASLSMDKIREKGRLASEKNAAIAAERILMDFLMDKIIILAEDYAKNYKVEGEKYVVKGTLASLFDAINNIPALLKLQKELSKFEASKPPQISPSSPLDQNARIASSLQARRAGVMGAESAKDIEAARKKYKEQTLSEFINNPARKEALREAGKNLKNAEDKEKAIEAERRAKEAKEREEKKKQEAEAKKAEALKKAAEQRKEALKKLGVQTPETVDLSVVEAIKGKVIADGAYTEAGNEDLTDFLESVDTDLRVVAAKLETALTEAINTAALAPASADVIPVPEIDSSMEPAASQSIETTKESQEAAAPTPTSTEESQVPEIDRSIEPATTQTKESTEVSSEGAVPLETTAAINIKEPQDTPTAPVEKAISSSSDPIVPTKEELQEKVIDELISREILRPSQVLSTSPEKSVATLGFKQYLKTIADHADLLSKNGFNDQAKRLKNLHTELTSYGVKAFGESFGNYKTTVYRLGAPAQGGKMPGYEPYRNGKFIENCINAINKRQLPENVNKPEDSLFNRFLDLIKVKLNYAFNTNYFKTSQEKYEADNNVMLALNKLREDILSLQRQSDMAPEPEADPHPRPSGP